LPGRSSSSRRAPLQALLSLWAPLACFVAALVAYVALVEIHRPSAAWARPLLFAFGQACAAWAALLALALLLWPRLRRSRAAAAVAAVAAEPALPRGRGAGFLEVGVGVGKALVLAALVRIVLVEPYRIPTGSMLPTLQIGDQVFVNKLIYGVRIPFTNWVPFVVVRPPRRGDVIVFNNPAVPSKDFIKRVVGVPGDTVEIVDEVIRINGEVQPRTLVEEEHIIHSNVEAGPWYNERVSLYEESLGGLAHATLQSRNHPRGSLTEGPYQVPEGHVFVLGDNRDASTDSRYGLGGSSREVRFVPYGHIKGKAMVIWLSLSYGGLFSEWTGGTGLRTDRLFLPVQ
jgi:signal peptidase I